MINFVDCGLKSKISIVNKDTKITLLRSVCRFCGCTALPDLLQLFWEYDNNIHNQVISHRYKYNSLQTLSLNPKISEQPVYDAVRKLIELGVVVNYGIDNPILLFLVNVVGTEYCCDYGRRVELSISPVWDTIELLIDAPANMADENDRYPQLTNFVAKMSIYMFLIDLSYNEPPCSDCVQTLSTRSPLRRECFDRFLKFISKLVRCDLARDVFSRDVPSRVEKFLCTLSVCLSYEDEERVKMTRVLCEHWLGLPSGWNAILQTIFPWLPSVPFLPFPEVYCSTCLGLNPIIFLISQWLPFF